MVDKDQVKDIVVYGKKLEEWTDKELIVDLRAVHSAIEDFGCFGVRDLQVRELYAAELERRGYFIDADEELLIVKVPDGEEGTE